MKRVMAILLIAMLVLTQLPLGVFAFEPRKEAAGVRSGVFTAGDGAEYAVLYNDYITLYVNTLDGGFAVLPATERFDGAKPLSHAAFRVDGGVYRYGAYYGGMSGAVSIAPEVNADNILESHWQIGDFVISQIFGITSDTLHDDSYAVKIGYAAQYFGEGDADIAGRILLDTQFTPDESAPVMLMDGADNLALVESEAEIRPAPSTALVSKAFIEEANAAAKLGENGGESARRVYTDSPNKGYLVFDDSAFTTPDGVVFAEFGWANGAEFEYAPDWEHKLFNGSGADSAALLCWDGVGVSGGNQAAFGTNYGFYDLKRGRPRFDPAPAPAEFSAMSAEARTGTFFAVSGDTATVNIVNIDQYIPEEWFEIKASVPLNKEIRDNNQSFMRGTVAEGVDFQICLDYKPGAPWIIRETVKKYTLWIGWDGGQEWNGVNVDIDVGESYTLDTA
ncbi:MAG: hypothetical protein LBL26_07010, partial [Peptococcaceae bacterium]|nr:hypothetical protein [Peptococcaceae bacterium]